MSRSLDVEEGHTGCKRQDDTGHHLNPERVRMFHLPSGNLCSKILQESSGDDLWKRKKEQETERSSQ